MKKIIDKIAFYFGYIPKNQVIVPNVPSPAPCMYYSDVRLENLHAITKMHETLFCQPFDVMKHKYIRGKLVEELIYAALPFVEFSTIDRGPNIKATLIVGKRRIHDNNK